MNAKNKTARQLSVGGRHGFTVYYCVSKLETNEKSVLAQSLLMKREKVSEAPFHFATAAGCWSTLWCDGFSSVQVLRPDKTLSDREPDEEASF